MLTAHSFVLHTHLLSQIHLGMNCTEKGSSSETICFHFVTANFLKCVRYSSDFAITHFQSSSYGRKNQTTRNLS